MLSSSHSDLTEAAAQRLTHRVYRERFTGRRLLGVFLFLLAAVTFAVVSRDREEPLWVRILIPCFFVALALGLFLLREVTVDAAEEVVREAWRFFGRLTVWKHQRSLREFAAVRSQRVEVVTKGDRRVYCDVYLSPAAGAGKRLDVERFEMGEESGSPEGIAVGIDLARLTGLPFEDKT